MTSTVEQAKNDLMNSYRLLGFDYVEKSNCLPLYVENEKNKFKQSKPKYNFNFHRAKKLCEYRVKHLSPPNDYFNDMAVEYEYMGLYYDLQSGDYCSLRKSKRVKLEKDTAEKYNKKIRHGGTMQIGKFHPYTKNLHLRKTKWAEILTILTLHYDSHKLMMQKKKEEREEKQYLKEKQKRLRTKKKNMRFVQAANEGYVDKWKGIVL